MQYLVKEDGVNASMKDGRLVRIVHGESPHEALVHEVDALGEAVVVGVDEEGALLRVAERPGAGTGRCRQRLLRTRTRDCICGCTTKSWQRLGAIYMHRYLIRTFIRNGISNGRRVLRGILSTPCLTDQWHKTTN